MEGQPYTDLSVVECSRRQSVQFKAGNYSNNAIFTNKLDSGLKLNVGDKISVHATTISEIGAGNDTIDLKGESLGKTRTFNYIKSTPFSRYNVPLPYNLEESQGESLEPTTETIELKDNQANITIGYFKTANGENCFGLPRRFDHIPIGSGSNASLVFNANDCETNGATFHNLIFGNFIEQDYYADRNASAIYNVDPLLSRQIYKVRQDGTKYTIFGRVKTYFDTAISGTFTIETLDNKYDPALDVYNKYVELISIDIPPGRRSADFISEKFTRQLQLGNELNRHTLNTPYQNPGDRMAEGMLTGVYNTNTFKTFTCQTGEKFGKTNFDVVLNGKTTPPNKHVVDWYSGFQYVAFKRPDFVEAGRAMRVGGFDNASQAIRSINNNASSARSTANITLGYEYNKTNLNLISNFLKTQELYPEMWKITENASSPYFRLYKDPQLDTDHIIDTKNSRFLHLALINSYAGNASTISRKIFGSDNYSASNVATERIKNVQSTALFFDYDESQKDIYYDNPEYIVSGTGRLTYGFATKSADGYIVVHTTKIGGIPLKFYNPNYFVGNSINPTFTDEFQKVYLGYDYHFTAYGNAGMGLYSGYPNTRSYYNNTAPGVFDVDSSGVPTTSAAVTPSATNASVMNKCYIGAITPKLSYDNIKDRFGFTELYTPEFIGNNEGAGDEDKNPVIDGSGVCYKINKRLKRQNFSPGMCPYNDEQTIILPASNGSNLPHKLDFHNKSIYPWSIIDSQSGIFINDFGYDNDTWNDGFFNILGFSYDQVQASLTSDNKPSERINNINIQKLNSVTTQSVIKGEDVLFYNQNQYGAIFYDSRIKTSEILYSTTSVGVASKKYQWLPPLTIISQSNIVTAISVPKQMLRPFFTIRSNLLEDTNAYLGSEDSGQPLSTMAVVSKNYNTGDYYFGEASDLEFTITRPKMVTEITTAICDPDGTYSRVDDSSGVIYKIQTNRMLPGNIIAQMFQKK